MKKLLTAVLMLSLAIAAFAQTSPKREMRSVWMAAMGIDWPMNTTEVKCIGTSASAQANAKQQLIDYLDGYKKDNFTAVCIHVRSRADAMYKSSYEPWSASVSGTRGVDPGWDPLQFAIEECHKRGLECYAWVNPYRVNASNDDYHTEFDEDWRKRGIIFKYNQVTVFNPGKAEAREHCLKVIKEIYMNYDIDGMLFDDYFYPANGMSDLEDAVDYEDYKASKSNLSLMDWRRQNVNDFVKELYDEIQKDRPDMRFGIGPAGTAGYAYTKYAGIPTPPNMWADWQYKKIYADPIAWLKDGSIDFIGPQIYWAQSDGSTPYGPWCKWWADVAKMYGRHNYISIAAYKVPDKFGGNNNTGWTEMSQQVDVSRQYADGQTSGQIYYSAKYINGPLYTGMGDHLHNKVYKLPALTPLVDWKEHPSYSAPSNIKLANGKITWDKIPVQGRTIMRYTVYAVPYTVSDVEAMASGDGISNEYLLDVVYGTEYALPAALQDGCWYAVCAYDGYGYESEPGMLNYGGSLAEAVTLKSPADGINASWDQPFEWNPVANGTYRLQISTEAAFHTILTDIKDIKDTKVTADLGTFPDGATCYWRVMSYQPNCLGNISETRTFKAPVRSVAKPAPLLTPAHAAQINELDIVFSWSQVENSDVYTLLIDAEDGDFSSPLLTREVKGSSTTVRATTLGQGTFSWRVIAGGNRVKPQASSTRTFTINSLPTGTYEPGYTIRTDAATYKADGYTFENLWVRAVDSPFGNMSFESNGALNRGMVAVGDRVYISGRREASSDSEIYLAEYSAETGEHLRDITLADEGKVAYYPCNDVIKDTKGHVCIVNLSLKASTTPIKIHMVDLVTGKLTEVGSLTFPEGSEAAGRYDHIGIYGDVTKKYTVYAACASTNVLARWVVTIGGSTTSNFIKVDNFLPATSGHFGIAPRVHPISDYRTYVDGGATFMSMYDFRKTEMYDSFANTTDASAIPTNPENNGMAQFIIGKNRYAVYNIEPHSAGSRFALSTIGSKYEFSGMKLLAKFPQDGLGKVNSSTCSTPVDAIVNDDNTATVVVYSPGNGLAAYRFAESSNTGLDLVNSDAETIEITTRGLNVYTSVAVDFIRAYTTSGTAVAAANGTDCLELPGAGIYVITTPKGSKLVAVK